MSEHTHKQFDAEMEALRNGVLAMGGLVETQLERALEALEKGEASGSVDEVGAVEQSINRKQVEIDQQCAQVIAKRQPAAIDLRMILTVAKIVNDLERVGDEAKKVVYKAVQTPNAGALERVRHFDAARAMRQARDMLQLALDAFARLDLSAAAEVIERDEEIDSSFDSIVRHLVSYMMEDPRTISAALEVVFIAKSIERIGDHSKNVAESVVQVVKGKDVRHASADEIRAEVAGE